MVETNLERIKRLGIGIEIYFDNNLLDEVNVKEVRAVSERLKDLDILCTVHAPYMDLSPGGVDKKIREISKDRIKLCVEMANILQAKTIVCHPGYDRWRFDGNEHIWLEGSIKTWTEVIGAAGKGLLVLLENIFEEGPSTLMALFDHFKGKDLFFCFDTGHFNLFSKTSLEEWIIPLKGSIREFHLHDNHGETDEHLPIGRGTFPFRELKGLIRYLNLGDNIIYTTEIHEERYLEEGLRNMMGFIS